jgi:hypothetical protein
MSYIGEYVETPFLRHINEGDPYLKEFRTVRHFPTLRGSCTRALHAVERNDASTRISVNSASTDGFGGSLKHARQTARRAAEQAARQAAPPSEAAMRRSFRQSLVTNSVDTHQNHS